MIGFKLAGVVGLILIIIGNAFNLKNKLRIKYTYPLLLLGGIGLLMYSISIKDTIFIVLQSLFIIMATIETVLISKK